MNTGSLKSLLATQAGREVELFTSKTEQTETQAFRGKIASFSSSSSSGLSARTVKGGKMGFAYTERVEPDQVRRTMEQSGRNADFTEHDEGNALYDGAGERESTRFESDDIPGLSVERKNATALALEEICLQTDPRITNVPDAYYGDSSSRVTIVTSRGLAKTRVSSSCYAYVQCIAKEGDETQVGFYAQLARNFADLDTRLIATTAAEEALSKLGAREIASGTYAVLLSNESASSLIGAFAASGASPFYAENMQKGRSKLAGKVGQSIGCGLFTVVDDPLVWSRGAAEFDDEGVDTAKITVVDRGVFREPVYSVYSARREKRASNGRSRRGSYAGGIGTAMMSPILENGSSSEADLIAGMHRGIYVTSVEGLHAGIDAISGDFSAAAGGFMVENGTKSFPVKSITIAGNFFELIGRIVGLANNRRTDGLASLSCPSMLVEAMAVSGK